jgi:hypothetical protein
MTTTSNLNLISDASESIAESGTLIARANLADIVFALETQNASCHAYLDLTTGEVHVITEEDEMCAVDDEPVPDWQARAVAVARAVASGSRDYLPLPTSLDVDEYSILERFCNEQRPEIRDQLLLAVRGKGAFRMFRETIHCLGLVDNWERYRVHALERIAVEWCDRNNVAYAPTELPWMTGVATDDAMAQFESAAENAARLLNEPVYTHVTWRAKQGMSEQFIAAWNVLGDLFLELENPPLEVTLIKRADDPTVFHSIGSWSSLADAQAVSDDDRAIDALARISSLCDEGMPAIYEVVRRIRPE